MKKEMQGQPNRRLQHRDSLEARLHSIDRQLGSSAFANANWRASTCHANVDH
jgi:hypothetical protein